MGRLDIQNKTLWCINLTNEETIGSAGPLPVGEFPRDLQNSPLDHLNPKFFGLYIALLFLIGGGLVGLSMIKVDHELSQKEILKIKQRYAQLELKPKTEEVEKKKEETAEQVKKKEEVKEKPQPKTPEEAQQAREARREETSASRAQVREALREQISNQGLFAELTALGEEGGDGEVIDQILNKSQAPSIGEINLSSSNYTPRPSQAEVPRERRGERIAGAGIQEQKIEKATINTVKVNAELQLASKENIQGASGSARSAEVIQSTIAKIQGNIKLQFEKYLRQDPNLSGKVEVEFLIKADGSVTDVQVVRSTLNQASFERRLVSLIERVNFGPADSDVKITFPFVFSSSKV